MNVSLVFSAPDPFSTLWFPPCVVFIYYHNIPDAVNKRTDIPLSVFAVNVHRSFVFDTAHSRILVQKFCSALRKVRCRIVHIMDVARQFITVKKFLYAHYIFVRNKKERDDI